jgi:hypothetical protein
MMFARFGHIRLPKRGTPAPKAGSSPALPKPAFNASKLLK